MQTDMSVIATVTQGFKSSSIGLVITGNPTYEQWVEFGQQLSHEYSTIQWTIGDWLIEGERRYGEMYSQILDNLMYNYGTLRNYASIAARIPKEVRNPKLRFHQSKYVAPLEPDEQKRILDFAADKNLSGDDIQELVNKVLGKSARTQSGHESDMPANPITEAEAWVNPTGDYLYIENQPQVQAVLRAFWHKRPDNPKVRITITELTE